MSDRIAIMIPSRDRPELLWKACASIFDTSEAADVFCFVDEDQREMYDAARPKIMGKGTFKIAYGPRCGPVAAALALQKCIQKEKVKYTGIGLFVDDCTFTIPGWDQAVLYEADRLGPIWAMSPAHSEGAYMDFAIVSREWADRLGWIAYPALRHFGWPSIIEALGEATKLHRLPPELMFIQHDRQEPGDKESAREDMRQLSCFFTTNRYMRALESLRTTQPVEALAS